MPDGCKLQLRQQSPISLEKREGSSALLTSLKPRFPEELAILKAHTRLIFQKIHFQMYLAFFATHVPTSASASSGFHLLEATSFSSSNPTVTHPLLLQRTESILHTAVRSKISFYFQGQGWQSECGTTAGFTDKLCVQSRGRTKWVQAATILPATKW